MRAVRTRSATRDTRGTGPATRLGSGVRAFVADPNLVSADPGSSNFFPQSLRFSQGCFFFHRLAQKRVIERAAQIKKKGKPPLYFPGHIGVIDSIFLFQRQSMFFDAVVASR